MGHWAHPDYYDAGGNLLKANVTKLVLLPSQSADYAAANAAKLAEVVVAGADFTLGNGDVSGRKVSVGAKAAVAVTATGTANHLGLLDVAGTRLLRVFPLSVAIAVTSGGTVDISAFQDEARAVS